MESEEVAEEGELEDSGGSSSAVEKVNNSRLSRKLNEKIRRDRLNGLIAELAEEVPTIKYAHRRLDKSSVLRLTVSFLKLHQGLKNKKFARENIFKTKNVYSRISNYMMNDGMLMVFAQSGMILYVSPAVKQILGHHQSDMIGYDISRFVHQDDMECFLAQCQGTCATDKEAAFASFEENDEVNRAHNVHILGPQKNSFYARMLKISKSVKKKDRGEEEIKEEDPYDLMQVKTYREQENTRPGEELWIVASVKPFVQETIKEISVSISEFQRNNEFASMHSLDGKIVASEHRSSLFHGFMVSEVLGKSPYFFISDDDLEYVCRSHQLIMTDEEIPSTVFRMKTLMGNPIYVQSRSIIIKDKWTKEPKSIVSVNEILSNEKGQMMLDYQKEQVEKLTKMSEMQSAIASGQEKETDRKSKCQNSDRQGLIDSRVSDSDSESHSSGSDLKDEQMSLNRLLTDDVLEIHKCTGKSLGEIYEEKALTYHHRLQHIDSPTSSLSSDSGSYSVKRSHESLDSETNENSKDSCSDDSLLSGNQSSYHSFSVGQNLPDSSEDKKTEENWPASGTSSKPILKGILEGRLKFVGQNKYVVSQAHHDVASAMSSDDSDSKCSVAGSNFSVSSDFEGSVVAMSPSFSGDYREINCGGGAAESFVPIQCPNIGSATVLEDKPMENADICKHFTKQLLMKYGQIKDTFSSHKLTIAALREHLEKSEVLNTMNTEQQQMHSGLISRLRQAEGQISIQDQLLAELEEELDVQKSNYLTY